MASGVREKSGSSAHPAHMTVYNSHVGQCLIISILLLIHRKIEKYCTIMQTANANCIRLFGKQN